MGYRVEGIPCADEYVPPVSLPKKMAPRTKRKSIKFEATVWAITEVMVQPLAKSRPAEEIAPVSAFLLETHSKLPEIGRANVVTPCTNAHLVCRLLLENNTISRKSQWLQCIYLQEYQ